jgi:hypothetical protein
VNCAKKEDQLLDIIVGVQTWEKLGCIQKKMGKPEHNLISDADTQWNSEYNMFSTLDEQRGPISAELV